MRIRKPEPREPCKKPGCGSLIRRSKTGYCAAHCATAFECVVDGCTNRVSATSRSKCCHGHKAWADKLKRAGVSP